MVSVSRVSLIIILAISALTASCGDSAPERSPNSNSGSGSNTQSLKDFKLRCKDINLSAPNQSSYECSLSNRAGTIFRETATQVLDVYIINGTSKLVFQKNLANTLTSFTFAANSNDKSNIFIKLLVVNPQANNQTLYETSDYLANILYTGGEGTSTPGTSTTGTSTTDTSTTGTPTATVSFLSDVQPIMINKCTNCHVPYSNYTTVKNNFGSIMVRINAGTMPPSGKLPSSTIQILTNWGSGSFAP